ncbi:MAG TPA: hypothetical protein ENI74_06715 [Gammaproteobacteria bacterium]|nr:hypothetical protein [Gammaproteobacteria bacterium]
MLSEIYRELRYIQLITRHSEWHAVDDKTRAPIGGQLLCGVNYKTVKTSGDVRNVFGDLCGCSVGCSKIDSE